MVAKAKPRKITSIRKKQSKVGSLTIVCGVGDGWSIIQRRHYIAFYLIENPIYYSDDGDHKICVRNGGLYKSCVTLLWIVILKKDNTLAQKTVNHRKVPRPQTEPFENKWPVQYLEDPLPFVISYSIKLQRFKLDLQHLSFLLTRIYSGENLEHTLYDGFVINFITFKNVY
jgi:hypothetical protein